MRTRGVASHGSYVRELCKMNEMECSKAHPADDQARTSERFERMRLTGSLRIANALAVDRHTPFECGTSSLADEVHLQIQRARSRTRASWDGAKSEYLLNYLPSCDRERSQVSTSLDTRMDGKALRARRSIDSDDCSYSTGDSGQSSLPVVSDSLCRGCGATPILPIGDQESDAVCLCVPGKTVMSRPDTDARCRSALTARMLSTARPSTPLNDMPSVMDVDSGSTRSARATMGPRASSVPVPVSGSLAVPRSVPAPFSPLASPGGGAFGCQDNRVVRGGKALVPMAPVPQPMPTCGTVSEGLGAAALTSGGAAQGSRLPSTHVGMGLHNDQVSSGAGCRSSGAGNTAPGASNVASALSGFPSNLATICTGVGPLRVQEGFVIALPNAPSSSAPRSSSWVPPSNEPSIGASPSGPSKPSSSGPSSSGSFSSASMSSHTASALSCGPVSSCAPGAPSLSSLSHTVVCGSRDSNSIDSRQNKERNSSDSRDNGGSSSSGNNQSGSNGRSSSSNNRRDDNNNDDNKDDKTSRNSNKGQVGRVPPDARRPTIATVATMEASRAPPPAPAPRRAPRLSDDVELIWGSGWEPRAGAQWQMAAARLDGDARDTSSGAKSCVDASGGSSVNSASAGSFVSPGGNSGLQDGVFAPDGAAGAAAPLMTSAAAPPASGAAASTPFPGSGPNALEDGGAKVAGNDLSRARHSSGAAAQPLGGLSGPSSRSFAFSAQQPTPGALVRTRVQKFNVLPPSRLGGLPCVEAVPLGSGEGPFLQPRYKGYAGVPPPVVAATSGLVRRGSGSCVSAMAREAMVREAGGKDGVGDVREGMVREDGRWETAADGGIICAVPMALDGQEADSGQLSRGGARRGGVVEAGGGADAGTSEGEKYEGKGQGKEWEWYHGQGGGPDIMGTSPYGHAAAEGMAVTAGAMAAEPPRHLRAGITTRSGGSGSADRGFGGGVGASLGVGLAEEGRSHKGVFYHQPRGSGAGQWSIARDGGNHSAANKRRRDLASDSVDEEGWCMERLLHAAGVLGGQDGYEGYPERDASAGKVEEWRGGVSRMHSDSHLQRNGSKKRVFLADSTPGTFDMFPPTNRLALSPSTTHLGGRPAGDKWHAISENVNEAGQVAAPWEPTLSTRTDRPRRSYEQPPVSTMAPRGGHPDGPTPRHRGAFDPYPVVRCNSVPAVRIVGPPWGSKPSSPERHAMTGAVPEGGETRQAARKLKAHVGGQVLNSGSSPERPVCSGPTSSDSSGDATMYDGTVAYLGGMGKPRGLTNDWRKPLRAFYDRQAVAGGAGGAGASVAVYSGREEVEEDAMPGPLVRTRKARAALDTLWMQSANADRVLRRASLKAITGPRWSGFADAAGTTKSASGTPPGSQDAAVRNRADAPPLASSLVMAVPPSTWAPTFIGALVQNPAWASRAVASDRDWGMDSVMVRATDDVTTNGTIRPGHIIGSNHVIIPSRVVSSAPAGGARLDSSCASASHHGTCERSQGAATAPSYPPMATSRPCSGSPHGTAVLPNGRSGGSIDIVTDASSADMTEASLSPTRNGPGREGSPASHLLASIDDVVSNTTTASATSLHARGGEDTATDTPMGVYGPAVTAADAHTQMGVADASSAGVGTTVYVAGTDYPIPQGLERFSSCGAGEQPICAAQALAAGLHGEAWERLEMLHLQQQRQERLEKELMVGVPGPSEDYASPQSLERSKASWLSSRDRFPSGVLVARSRDECAGGSVLPNRVVSPQMGVRGGGRPGVFEQSGSQAARACAESACLADSLSQQFLAKCMEASLRLAERGASSGIMGVVGGSVAASPPAGGDFRVAGDKAPSAAVNKEPSAAGDKAPSAAGDKAPSAAVNKEPSIAGDAASPLNMPGPLVRGFVRGFS
eukprot:jgi/Mesvir1/15263/Mv06484-RA.1